MAKYIRVNTYPDTSKSSGTIETYVTKGIGVTKRTNVKHVACFVIEKI